MSVLTYVIALDDDADDAGAQADDAGAQADDADAQGKSKSRFFVSLMQMLGS